MGWMTYEVLTLWAMKSKSNITATVAPERSSPVETTNHNRLATFPQDIVGVLGSEHIGSLL